MTWDGFGKIRRPHNFSADAEVGIKILPERLDAEFDSMQADIENLLRFDGKNAPRADLPMGGQAFTEVAAASAEDQYLRVVEHQKTTHIYIRDRGGANFMFGSAEPALDSYDDGLTIHVKVKNTNTTENVVLRLNDMSAKPVVDQEGLGVRSSSLISDGIYQMRFSSADDWFQLIRGSEVLAQASEETAGAARFASTAEIASASATDLFISPAGLARTYLERGKFTAVMTAPTYTTQSASCSYQKFGSLTVMSLLGFGAKRAVGENETRGFAIPAVITPNSTVISVGLVDDEGVVSVSKVRITEDGSCHVYRNLATTSASWPADVSGGFASCTFAFSDEGSWLDTIASTPASAAVPLVVTIKPQALYAYDAAGPRATTNSASAGVVGGTGPYTYAWSKAYDIQTGVAIVSADADTDPATNFYASADAIPWTVETAWKCAVTDDTGKVAEDTVIITIEAGT